MSNFCAGRRRIASYTPCGGLSASTHRFLVPPRPRDGLSDAVLSGGVFVTGVSGVNQWCPSRVLATMSLNTAAPEHLPVDQIETYAFRPGWDTDMAQRVVMWATACLLGLTDPQFRPCWVVHCLGSHLPPRNVFFGRALRSLVGTGETHVKSHFVSHFVSHGGLISGERKTGSIGRGRIFCARSCSSWL